MSTAASVPETRGPRRRRRDRDAPRRRRAAAHSRLVRPLPPRRRVQPLPGARLPARPHAPSRAHRRRRLRQRPRPGVVQPRPGIDLQGPRARARPATCSPRPSSRARAAVASRSSSASPSRSSRARPPWVRSSAARTGSTASSATGPSVAKYTRATLLALSAGLATVGALVLVVAGSELGSALADNGWSDVLGTVWSIGRWPLGAALVVGAAALLFETLAQPLPARAELARLRLRPLASSCGSRSPASSPATSRSRRTSARPTARSPASSA